MCGLVGVAGGCTVKNKDIFSELLLVDVVRGSHSTGAAAIKRFDGEILLTKAPIASPYFVGTKEYRDMIDTLSVKCLIGHNRYATVGAKTPENAHPFQFDHLVGAHNGTLDDWALRGLDNWKEFGTDSEALYNSIHEHGIKDTIAEVSGAWALTWFDKLGSTMNLLRNAKRPLFYTYSTDRESLYWASEADMLEWVLKRNGVKLFDDSIFECEADHHYKWSIPANVGGKFEKPLCTKMEGRAASFRQAYGNSGSWKEDNGYSTSSYTTYGVRTHAKTSTDPKYITAPAFTPGVSTKHVHKKIDTSKKFRPPYKDAYGRIINKENFKKLVPTGCVFCDDQQTVWGEFIFPLKDDMDGRKLYLCKECYDDDDIRQLVENCI